MLRKLAPDSRPGRHPWSSRDLAVLRGHLKAGTTLLDTALALRRDAEDVESKIAELYQPGQRLLPPRPPRPPGL